MCCNPNLQGDGIWRWGLEEEVGLFIGGHEGGAFMMRFLAIWEETPESLGSHSLPVSVNRGKGPSASRK